VLVALMAIVSAVVILLVCTTSGLWVGLRMNYFGDHNAIIKDETA
jgi:hypothetical protein